MANEQDIITMIVRSEMTLALRDMNTFNTQLNTAKKNTSSMIDGFNKAKGSLMTFIGAVAAMGAVVYKAVEAQSALNEQTNYWEETFKNAQGTAYEGIEQLTKSYAISQREAMQLTAEIGSLAKGMNMSSKEAAVLSTEIVKMAADWGSFKNMRTEDVLTAIRSGLVGEAEPMRRFGADLRETAIQAKALEMGLWKGKGALDAKTKALAAYNIMADVFQKTNAKGDMIRTADSWANQVKRLKANAEDFSASIGSKLIPALQLYIKDMNDASEAGMGEKIGEIIGKFLLVVKAAYHAQQILFNAVDYGVSLISMGIDQLGYKFGELIKSDTIMQAFKEDYEQGEKYLKEKEGNIEKHFKKIDDITTTWSSIEKAKTKKTYKDTERAMSDAANTKKQMTAQEIEAMKKGRIEYLEYIGEHSQAVTLKEQEKGKKLIETAKLSGEEQKKVEVAVQKKISDEIGKEITASISNVMNKISQFGNFGKQMFDSFVAIGNQQAKNSEIRLDQQTKFFEMQLENQRAQFETSYTEKYDALENERMMEEESIKSQIMDETTRAAILESLTKKYNDKKQALDNQKGVEEKKMLEEQQKMKEQMDARSMYLKHKEALRQKEMSFIQAVIAANLASVQAFASCMYLPFPANVIAGGITAVATLATGLILANTIRNQPVPWLAEGGLIRGTSQGTLVRAGEGFKSEAVVPLETDKAREIFGTNQSGINIIINANTINGTEEVARNFAISIDKALYRLKQDRASLAFR